MSDNPKIRQLISWEKWKDPWTAGGKDEDSGEWSESEDDEMNHGPVQMTPMGMMPLNSHSTLSKRFNFWLAHTNFNITPNIRTILESIEGVETLDIFTRYKMRVGIGKLLDDETIRKEIGKVIAKHLNG